MNRRIFVKSAATLFVFVAGCSQTLKRLAGRTGFTTFRVRPGDPLWPSDLAWTSLRHRLRGALIKLESPFTPCVAEPQGSACTRLFFDLQNPYFIRDEPALTQTLGWLDAWKSAPSAYAVAVKETADVVTAVNFARDNNLRLVVKGGGHSYQGTSSSADSFLVWMRSIDSVLMHDSFTPHGSMGNVQPQTAVSVGAGAIWGHVYDVVTTKGGRYVQGGGCTTVGVAGLIQSGGFGSFSKNYGLAAAGLVEAEVVTADGVTRIANAFVNPDLFWALKGGGGGSFGVVTRLTLRTRELPEFFGGVFGTIKATSDIAYRRLVAEIVRFYEDKLFNPHWGEQIRFGDNKVKIQMVLQGLNQAQAEEVWRPLKEWIAKFPADLLWEAPLGVAVLPARQMWDAALLKNFPGLIAFDERHNAPLKNFYWASDRGQAGQFLYGYRSAWLPATLLASHRQKLLTDALVGATKHWEVSLHFNKGLAGAPPDELAAVNNTAINPAVGDAFALAIIAGEGQPSSPEIPGHKPDEVSARRSANAINRAMEELVKPVPNSGSYLSESDFFEQSWQRSFWGSNYQRLLEVKKRYDPDGLFFVHHGVGSEDWTDNGFARVP